MNQMFSKTFFSYAHILLNFKTLILDLLYFFLYLEIKTMFSCPEHVNWYQYFYISACLFSSQLDRAQYVLKQFYVIEFRDG